MSKRGDQWKQFADEVYRNIEEYTVPQYGDEGKDQITGYSADDCITMVKKYNNRYGTNQREGQQLLDFLKIAHYTQCAWTKHQLEEKKEYVTFNGTGYSVFGRIFKELSKFKNKKIKITISEE